MAGEPGQDQIKQVDEAEEKEQAEAETNNAEQDEKAGEEQAES